jgi:hypothetical protein
LQLQFFTAASAGDAPQTIKISDQDTVSTVCGAADGTSFCGTREVVFYSSSTKKAITKWPHRAIDWDDESKLITFHPSTNDEVGEFEILFTVTL